MERVGITEFMGRCDMVKDYVKNQKVSDSNPNVMKIVKNLKRTQQLWQNDLKTIIKIVGNISHMTKKINTLMKLQKY